jgi:NAD(P)-dependent dehydrogenase (short-subunit alcohol dehydrogenase family)
MENFAGKVAVITGAGSGFGREFARLLAQQGARLVLADIEQPALEAIRDELVAQGAEVLCQRTDVAKAADVEALAAATLQRFETVHLLFNNAGVASGGLIWENTLQDWEWVIGVNLWGVIHGVRVFVPIMLQKMNADPEYSGHIVNTSSVAGLLSPSNMGVYNVTKHGVVTISGTLYRDLRLIGARIGVSVLCPPFVPTGITQSHRNRPAELLSAGPATPSQLMAQAVVEKAVAGSRLTATDVGQMTLSAIRENQFYIVPPNSKITLAIHARCDDIKALRNPTDPTPAR